MTVYSRESLGGQGVGNLYFMFWRYDIWVLVVLEVLEYPSTFPSLDLIHN